VYTLATSESFELGFATVVYAQISFQLSSPFCLKKGGFFEGAKVFGRR
jgi:hypothetical protein